MAAPSETDRHDTKPAFGGTNGGGRPLALGMMDVWLQFLTISGSRSETTRVHRSMTNNGHGPMRPLPWGAS